MLKRTVVPAFYAKYALLNLLLCGVLYTLFYFDFLFIPFQQDHTYAVFLITAVGLIANFCVLRKSWEAAEWLGVLLVELGLMGTLLGFCTHLYGIDTNKLSGDPMQIIATLAPVVVLTMKTSFFATLLGYLLYKWTDLQMFLLTKEE